MLKLLRPNLSGRLRAAQRSASRKIAARFSRGNVSVQFGRYLNDSDLLRLRMEADAATSRLQRRVLKR